MILRNLSSEEVCIVAGWIAITRSLAKVFFATEITEEMSFKSFFSKVSAYSVADCITYARGLLNHTVHLIGRE